MSVISTLDQLIGAAKQRLQIIHTTSMTGVATSYQSLIAIAGDPGAGTLAGTSITTGVVPTDATAGVPVINPFGASATGYLSRLEVTNTVASRVAIYDLLWKGGAYPFNQTLATNTPTSYSSRVPNGTDYNTLEIWYEQVTAGTGTQNVAVTYNDEGGVSSTTPVVAAPGAMIVGRMFQVPLVAGDKGVQGITGVAATVASAGTFNLLVMRKLGEARINLANFAVVQGPLETGMPVVFTDSALVMLVAADSTATGIPCAYIDIANG